jgi:hypothetical protein
VVGDRATLLGLKAALHLNGMEAIVLSALKPIGRLDVVLTDGLSTGELKYYLKWGAKDFSWVPDGKKKSIKEGNLKRATTLFLPAKIGGIPSS